jgi:membrane-bound ClpP family serine protease
MSIIALVLAVMLLAVLEVIIPSGGIISIVASICAIAALVQGFNESELIGWLTLSGMVLGTPGSIWLGFKILPYTPFVLSQRSEGHAKVDGLEQFIGEPAIAATPLRPIGFVEIHDQRLEATSRGEFLLAGTPVIVIGVRTGELIVERSEASASMVSDDDGRGFGPG